MSRIQEELERHISQFDKETYFEELRAYMQKYYCTFDNGHASENVVNHLKNVLS